MSQDELNGAVRFVIRDLENFRDFPEIFWQFINIILLFKLLLIILSPPQLSLIVKVPQIFENLTILSFTMALGAHMHPYSYMYYAAHRDGVLQNHYKCTDHTNNNMDYKSRYHTHRD